MTFRRIAHAPMAAILALAMAAGCGDEDGDRSRLEQALATIPAKEPVGSGFAWIDVEMMREAGDLAGQLGWARAALGPEARELANPSPELAEIGVDPQDADAIVAVTSNYPSSVRFDGVDPAGISRSLEESGATTGEDRGWTTFDIGSQRSIPLDTPAEPLRSLGARGATREDGVIFARADIDRSNMIGRDGVATDDDEVAAAAACLGDVMAARLMLNNHTHVPGLGPDLMAMGVLAPPEGPGREVLCAVDDDPARVEEATAGLERTFAPGAKDQVSGERMRGLYSDASVEAYEEDGLSAVRVVLDDAPGSHPGQLFGAFDRGSVITYLGLQPPPLPDELRDDRLSG